MIVDVELYYYEPQTSDEDGTWMAEWGVRGGSESTEDSNVDLGELITALADDVRRSFGRVTGLAWVFQFGGDRSPEETRALVAASGVTLPATT